ncbi:YALIA101S03e08724g1_1 [Yarrowia lipolytica]|nr:hypothetical protein YALI2_E00701g [Yarrowia lipolytica]SEI33034.1 YALIA101S03e08724g1_1 [Yarrowia lipolytica]VBB82531.1 Hypothetical protein conserved in the Yarrowia clade [Yarrowia lipolytica]
MAFIPLEIPSKSASSQSLDELKKGSTSPTDAQATYLYGPGGKDKTPNPENDNLTRPVLLRGPSSKNEYSRYSEYNENGQFERK